MNLSYCFFTLSCHLFKKISFLKLPRVFLSFYMNDVWVRFWKHWMEIQLNFRFYYLCIHYFLCCYTFCYSCGVGVLVVGPLTLTIWLSSSTCVAVNTYHGCLLQWSFRFYYFSTHYFLICLIWNVYSLSYWLDSWKVSHCVYLSKSDTSRSSIFYPDWL